MRDDNEDREAFAFWTDVTTEAWTTDERKGRDAKKVEVGLCAGIVVEAGGVSVRVEAGGAGNVTCAALSREKERALYEALRVRFDAEHRARVEQAALAKLSPLEQDVLRGRWTK
jgi:hypothetical protein